MDIFMVDSNAMDAKDLDKDSEHNICGAEHNPPGATCASAGPAEGWIWCFFIGKLLMFFEDIRYIYVYIYIKASLAKQDLCYVEPGPWCLWPY